VICIINVDSAAIRSIRRTDNIIAQVVPQIAYVV
jgi:hypothetical protein